MFWERITPIYTDRLTNAVAASYQSFAGYRLSGPLVVCNCPVCMDPACAEILQQTPLRDISSRHLAEYTNSAHGYDRDVIERQFKYFLPRYLDLIAACDPPSSLDIDTCLTRLEGYRSNWPTEEVAAVDEFFEAYLEACLKQRELLDWPVGPRLTFDSGAVLTMIALAGGDLEAALRCFENSPDPGAALHMASLRGEIRWRNGDPYYDNAHLASRKQAASIIGAWLRQDHLTDRIINAASLLNNQDYDDILEIGMT